MKILVIRFSSIGDIVLTTPVVRCLKNQVAGAEVHYLTKASMKQVIQHHPSIDKIHELESTSVEALKNEQFDWIIDLHNNLRSRKITSAINAPINRFRKLNLKKWLWVHFGINTLPAVHIVDRYLETVAALGVKNDGLGLDFPIPQQTVLPEHLPAAYIALVLGAAHATKQIPQSKLEEYIHLSTQSIVLLGGSAEKELGETLSNRFENCINLAGKTNLFESALVVKNAIKVITPDTGMMHIAAALNVKTEVIWGNTAPEFGMYPYGNDGNFTNHEVKLNCRPCSKIGHKKCPKGHFDCMMKQDVSSW